MAGSEATRISLEPGAKLITIYSGDLAEKSNYQDLGRYAEVDLAIAADAEATLPYLIEACRKLITSDRKRAFAERGAKYAEAAKRTREQALEQARGPAHTRDTVCKSAVWGFDSNFSRNVFSASLRDQPVAPRARLFRHRPPSTQVLGTAG